MLPHLYATNQQPWPTLKDQDHDESTKQTCVKKLLWISQLPPSISLFHFFGIERLCSSSFFFFIFFFFFLKLSLSLAYYITFLCPFHQNRFHNI
jgi:hypothetical protein